MYVCMYVCMTRRLVLDQAPLKQVTQQRRDARARAREGVERDGGDENAVAQLVETVGGIIAAA